MINGAVNGQPCYLSVCSGIEAASVAWEPLGFKPAGFAEIELFPSAVLVHHWPDVVNYGDLNQLPALVANGDAPAPDILVGGTPCQAFSVAGLRAGLSDARGALTLAFVRLANAIDDVRTAGNIPECVIVWENVPGVLSSKDNAFGHFLAGLAGEDMPLKPPGKKWGYAGAVLGPQRSVAWRTFDAQYFGLAQRRRRVFVVASARNGFDPCEVLFESEGMRRDIAPRRETGEETAGTLDGRAAGGGFPGTQGAVNGHVVSTLDASYHRLQGCSGQDANHGHSHLVPGGFSTSGAGFWREGIGALRARKQDSHENLVAPVIGPLMGGDLTRMGASEVDSGHYLVQAITGDITHALNTANNGKHSSEDGTGRGVPVIAQTVALRGRDGGATAELGGDVATALRASSGGGDKPHVLTVHGTQHPVTSEDLAQTLGRNSGQENAVWVREVAQTITQNYGKQLDNSDTALGPTVVASQMAVRRLMPVECETLQGFPKNHTLIPIRGKPAVDGPRYKSIGNSMAVTVMRWIGRRIQLELSRGCLA